MRKLNDTGLIEDGLSPDGYGQWNIEPPDTYASWGEYLAYASHLAIDLYNKRKSEPLSHCRGSVMKTNWLTRGSVQADE